MTRLPTPGQDSGQWGTILNDFLSQTHTSTGTLRPGVVSSTNIQDGAITSTKLANDAVTPTTIGATPAIATHNPSTILPDKTLSVDNTGTLRIGDGTTAGGVVAGGGVFAPRRCWDAVVDGGLIPDGATDNSAAMTALLAEVLEGDEITFPTGDYRFSASIEITKSIKLSARWGRTLGSNPTNVRLRPLNAASQTAMDALIDIIASYVELDGILVLGHGYASGSVGVQYRGTVDNHSHQGKGRRVFVAQFDTGLRIGEYADHVTWTDCVASGNNHGVRIAKDSHNDFAFIDCEIAGNVTSSIYTEQDASITNLALLRTHLGFSQYGILCDPTSTAGGVFSLTLVSSPIESVSQGHIKLYCTGPLTATGGYWHWNGTPANPAVDIISPALLGSIDIDVQYVNANANCPYMVKIGSGTAYCPIRVRGAWRSANFAVAAGPNNNIVNLSSPALSLGSWVANTKGFNCMVYVSGGTVTAIRLGNAAISFNTGLVSGGFLLPAGMSIRVEGSVAPTWVWVEA